jgi:3-keto-5-aminohexanoate cleavage enzyme
MPHAKRKIIINACITGMVPTKAMNPHVPITPDEILQSALRCAELGASVIHIHARDGTGQPSWKKEIYARIIAGIRQKNAALPICVSTSGRNWPEFAKRSEVLELTGDLQPDLASLTVGSLNFINQESVNGPQMIEQLACKMRDAGIKPELEVFEPGMIHKAGYLIGRNILDGAAPYFNILLGSLGTAPLHPATWAAMHALLPDRAVWSLAGIGCFQLDANVIALASGGHVRVGLEDNLFFDREKTVPASNEMLVERIADLARTMQLEIAQPADARRILGI